MKKQEQDAQIRSFFGNRNDLEDTDFSYTTSLYAYIRYQVNSSRHIPQLKKLVIVIYSKHFLPLSQHTLPFSSTHSMYISRSPLLITESYNSVIIVILKLYNYYKVIIHNACKVSVWNFLLAHIYCVFKGLCTIIYRSQNEWDASVTN